MFFGGSWSSLGRGMLKLANLPHQNVKATNGHWYRKKVAICLSFETNHVGVSRVRSSKNCSASTTDDLPSRVTSKTQTHAAHAPSVMIEARAKLTNSLRAKDKHMYIGINLTGLLDLHVFSRCVGD